MKKKIVKVLVLIAIMLLVSSSLFANIKAPTDTGDSKAADITGTNNENVSLTFLSNIPAILKWLPIILGAGVGAFFAISIFRKYVNSEEERGGIKKEIIKAVGVTLLITFGGTLLSWLIYGIATGSKQSGTGDGNFYDGLTGSFVKEEYIPDSDTFSSLLDEENIAISYENKINL